MKLQLLLNTESKIAPAFLRLFLGTVLLGHGAQKLLGWYGGYGFEGTMNFFTQTVGLPAMLGYLIIFIEFFGSICLIAGLLTRVWAISIIGLFIGVIAISHWQNGFFMNWFGNQKGEGFEFFLLGIGMAISLAITGGGKFSLDALIQKYAKGLLLRAYA